MTFKTINFYSLFFCYIIVSKALPVTLTQTEETAPTVDMTTPTVEGNSEETSLVEMLQAWDDFDIQADDFDEKLFEILHEYSDVVEG